MQETNYLLGSIVASGPHLAPLGDPAYFGIASRHFVDETDHSLKATVRVTAPHFVGEWLEIEMSENILTAQPTRTDPTPLFMVFCTRAEECLVGEISIQPRSLDKYEGITRPVVLDGKTTIKGPDTGLEVVPLGGSLYNECQFLIAYPLEQPIPYTWEITSSESAAMEDLHLQSADASSCPG